MRRGPQLVELKLTMQESTTSWSSGRGDIRPRKRWRCVRALCSRAAQGVDNSEVAKRCRVTRQTVGKWRRRFLEQRLDGLLDEPRPGAPRKLDDARIEQLIATTLNERPRQASHWSTRLLATKLGVSQSTVSRAWRAFGLQPHRVETFKLSTDPLFMRQGARHRWVVPESSHQSDGAVRGREEPDSSLGSDPAAVAAGAGSRGATHP